ncbi:MAG: zinc-dependent metalloprotease [Sediminibacterium sp.]
MKKNLAILSLCVMLTGLVNAQRPLSPMAMADTSAAAGAKKEPPAKTGPKTFKEFITKKAVTQKGVFTVHFQDDKFYFDIQDSLLGRELIAVTRYAKVAGGARKYGGEQVNEQTIQFEKGPNSRIFMRVVSLISRADSTQTIAKAVKNSYLDPIVAAFDIKAYGKDSTSSIIDVTDFFKGDNQAVSLSSFEKRNFNLTGLAADRSYIETIKSYPINIEVKTVKTYNASASMPGSPAGGSFIPAAANAGAVTFELNTSILLLPKTPMGRRLFDSRVGYFADNFVEYSDDQQKVKNQVFAVRYRLEPKPQDLEKYKRGELVEPMKPIVYYVDPATPKKWVPYLIAGVNDWNIAFEKAGWKNAIVGKEWPNDSTMSLEDARFSVIRYFASDIENAYGPQVHDPRSGEILESHVGWYHNVMSLVHDWYMVQTAAVDPAARKMHFDDELMGNLIRFVSSHEIGHTLGLRHNMGSSSKTPVEKLRDKTWVEANGHTASIMDYARFNYVAQPEDKIAQSGLFPRIGDYDKWAIQWGYTYTGENDAQEDRKINNKWIIDNLSKNPRVWFGGEGRNDDPRAQTEDLGDNAMLASEYGIKNLKRIIVNLPEWTKEEGDRYENLSQMYGQVVGQFSRYMGHVLRNVGGIQETFKSVEEKGDVYTPVTVATQKQAMQFFHTQLFTTPKWLMDASILNKFANPSTNERVQSVQTSILKSLLDKNRLYRITTSQTRFGASSYALNEMMDDLRKGLFSDVSKADIYRRNLQKTFVSQLDETLNPSASAAASAASGIRLGAPSADVENTDVASEAKAQLKKLAASLQAAKATATDANAVNHINDLQDRIKQALDPK